MFYALLTFFFFFFLSSRDRNAFFIRDFRFLGCASIVAGLLCHGKGLRVGLGGVGCREGGDVCGWVGHGSISLETSMRKEMKQRNSFPCPLHSLCFVSTGSLKIR